MQVSQEEQSSQPSQSTTLAITATSASPDAARAAGAKQVRPRCKLGGVSVIWINTDSRSHLRIDPSPADTGHRWSYGTAYHLCGIAPPSAADLRTWGVLVCLCLSVCLSVCLSYVSYLSICLCVWMCDYVPVCLCGSKLVNTSSTITVTTLTARTAAVATVAATASEATTTSSRQQQRKQAAVQAAATVRAGPQ